MLVFIDQASLKMSFSRFFTCMQIGKTSHIWVDEAFHLYASRFAVEPGLDPGRITAFWHFITLFWSPSIAQFWAETIGNKISKTDFFLSGFISAPSVLHSGLPSIISRISWQQEDWNSPLVRYGRHGVSSWPRAGQNKYKQISATRTVNNRFYAKMFHN